MCVCCMSVMSSLHLGGAGRIIVRVLYVGDVYLVLGGCRWGFWCVCCMSVMSSLHLGDVGGVFGVCAACQ